MDLPFGFSLTKSDSQEEIGGPGTSNYDGFIVDEEYNNDLRGTEGIKKYDKMRRSDAMVGASLMVMRLPILGTQWDIEPASEDEDDKRVAEFVEKNLFELQQDTWSDFLRQALLMLPFGVMPFEKVYQNVEWENQRRIGLKKIAPRMPKTIQRWKTQNDEEGITQLKADGEMVSIPKEKLVLFVFNKEGDNWWGRSVLRQAYKPWFLKKKIDKVDAIAIERQGVGVPKVKPPQGANQKDLNKAETLAQNMRANEKSYLVLPGPEWEAEFMDMKGKDTKSADKFIERQNREILMNTLSQFLQLGSEGSSGSWALSRDQSKLFLSSLESVADHIKETINRQLIKQLVDFNFEVDNYPKLQYGELGSVDWDKLSKSIKNLSAAGAITPGDKLKRRIREIMDLPQEETEEEETEEPQEEEEEMSEHSHKKKELKKILLLSDLC